MRMRKPTLVASTLLAAFFVAPTPAPSASPLPDEDETEEEGLDDEEPRWFAIVGGDVHTGDGGVLRGATILSKNGVIEEIGHGLFLPEGTETLDAEGLRVYPGLVALEASTRIIRGLFSGEAEGGRAPEHGPVAGRDPLHPDGKGTWPGSPGHVETGEARDGPARAALEKSDVEDTFDPFSQYLVLALASGITTAEQGGAAVKLRRGEIEGVLMKEKNLVSLTWTSDNPGTIRSLREKFERAAEYLREHRAWEERDGEDEDEPSRRGVDLNALRVLKDEALAYFDVDARNDLSSLARFAQRYGFRPVIKGCLEGWTVADELGRAGAYAIVTPRERTPKEEELVRPGGSSIENAAILHRSGVQVAVVPGNTSFDLGGITGRDLMHLPVEAGFAVRGGLPEQAALEAITLVPARILGVEHRVGTLEEGKDLDAIVTDGDVLHYRTFVQYAVVAGELVYDKEEELFYAHIRPRPERPDEEAEDAEEAPSEEAAEGEAVEEDEEDEQEQGDG